MAHEKQYGDTKKLRESRAADSSPLGLLPVAQWPLCANGMAFLPESSSHVHGFPLSISGSINLEEDVEVSTDHVALFVCWLAVAGG